MHIVQVHLGQLINDYTLIDQCVNGLITWRLSNKDQCFCPFATNEALDLIGRPPVF